MTYAKLKLALGITAAILLLGGVATVTLPAKERTNSSAGKNNSTNQPQILIKALFVKVPTKNVDAITKEFAKPEIPTDPQSKAFHDLIAKHRGVSFLSSPRISAGNGIQASLHLGHTEKINGTNADIGITFDVLPEVQSDTRVAMNIKADLREVTSGSSSSIQVTKIEENISPMTFGTTAMISSKISGDATTTTKNQDGQSDTLLVFINASPEK